jgi:hypothetical protein
VDVHILPLWPARENACNSIAVSNDLDGFVLHPEIERWKFLRTCRKEVQEIPLRHKSDKFAPGRDVAEIGKSKRHASNQAARRGHFLMRDFQEIVKQAEFVQNVESRWVDGIAAEVTVEIRVLFEHGHMNTVTSQKVAEHYAGRSASDYAARGLERIVRHNE